MITSQQEDGPTHTHMQVKPPEAMHSCHCRPGLGMAPPTPPLHLHLSSSSSSSSSQLAPQLCPLAAALLLGARPVYPSGAPAYALAS